MKKKLLLLAVMSIAGFIKSNGSVSNGFDPSDKILTIPFDVEVGIDDNTDNPFPHAIVRKPIVGIYGHTLYIYSGCDNTTIELLDVNGQVVYTTDVAEGTETLTLPASLTGTFELRIIRGSFTFVGEIDL